MKEIWRVVRLSVFLVGSLLLVCATPVLSTHAQAAQSAATAEITIVVHTAAGKPIVHARVSSDSLTLRGYTDATGKLRVRNVAVNAPYSRMNITITAHGYRTWQYRNGYLAPAQAIQLDAPLSHAQSGAAPEVIVAPTPRWVSHEAMTPTPVSKGGTMLPNVSNSDPPTTIRVYRTATGTVDTVSFDFYLKHVLPNEWLSGWNASALNAGAMAAKTYASFHVMDHSKYPGANYDLKDSTADQVYNPNVSAASTDTAVNTTAGYRMTRSGAIFQSQYCAGYAGDGGYSNQCGQTAGNFMSQWGTQYWAQQGKDFIWMCQYYYTSAVVTNDVGSGGGSTPAVAQNSDGRLEFFARGTDNALWHAAQSYAGSTTTVTWTSLNGVLTTDPVIGTNSDGRLEFFVRGVTGELWTRTQTSAGSSTWTDWLSLTGNLLGTPGVGRYSDGRLIVFARGIDNALYYRIQTSAGASTWVDWTPLYGSLNGDPVVGQNSDGRLSVFARGTDNALRYIVQTSPNGGWGGWETLLGTLPGKAAVARNSDGRLDVFARGTDNALYHRVQSCAGCDSWVDWAPLYGTLGGDPTVIQNSDGRLEVFARWSTNTLEHVAQTCAGCGWGSWLNEAGVLTSETAVARNTDGRVEVFLRGVNSEYWHRWQTSAGSSSLSGWTTLGIH